MNRISKLIKQYQSNKEYIGIYGLILYTAEHAHLRKVLNDSDYWEAFDEVSGNSWLIFSTRQAKGEYVFPNQPDFNTGCLYQMVAIWCEPNENKKLLEYIGVPSTKNLPLFVVFTEYKGDIVYKSIPLDDSSIQASYSSIKDAVKHVTKAVENIADENFSNQEGVFAAVSYAVDGYNEWALLKKGVKLLQWIRGGLIH